MLYSVILPTYNERENLPIIFYLLHQTFTKAKLDYEVVVVDDSSPDNTLEEAQALKKSFGHITIVSRKGKLGLGTAYIAGLKAAKGQRIILMDADLSHHPKFIPPMIQRMKETKVDKQLAAIGDVISRLLDHDILPWLTSEEDGTEEVIFRAATVIADRLCGAISDPIIRNAQEQRQLTLISQWLEARGYSKIELGSKMTVDALLVFLNEVIDVAVCKYKTESRCDGAITGKIET